jgi:hypothetical protein
MIGIRDCHLQGAQLTHLYLAKRRTSGVDSQKTVKSVCEVFWWFAIIKISNFAKGIMPKIFIELNLGRKYSNFHLNLKT